MAMCFLVENSGALLYVPLGVLGIGSLSLGMKGSWVGELRRCTQSVPPISA